jgi:hypothetical protein
MAALEKRRLGQKPSREESAALRRIEEAKAEEQRAATFAAVRKGEWAKWSGRQVKVINEQAERDGAPMLGATFSLPEFAKWFHDWRATIAPILAAAKKAVVGGPDANIGERINRARARREEAKATREELECRKALGQWVELEKVHEGLALFAKIMRGANQTVARKFGAEAQTILDDAIEDAIHVFRNHFGDGDPLNPDESADDGDGHAEQ